MLNKNLVSLTYSVNFCWRLCGTPFVLTNDMTFKSLISFISVVLSVYVFGISQPIWANACSGEDGVLNPQKLIENDRIVEPNQTKFEAVDANEFNIQMEMQWESIKNLPDNDIGKILFFRRFLSRSPQMTPYETHHEFEFKGYRLKNSTTENTIPPTVIRLDLPKKVKVGFIIGFHHLEKPWGQMVKQAIQQQLEINPQQITIIEIENTFVPTGEPSPWSAAEVRQAVKERGITHLVDLHEQLSTGVTFREQVGNPEFDNDHNQYDNLPTKTLDPVVPVWMMEQWYQGNITSETQIALNLHVSRIAQLLATIN